MWEVATCLRLRGSGQRWAIAQSLVARMRKFCFAVVWDVFGQEVKESRCVWGLLHALTCRL